MKTYWLASRPHTLTAAMVPVFLGAALAKFLLPALPLNLHFWMDFALVFVGCVLAQVISNLVNDLADFKSGLDSAQTTTRFKALVTGAMTPRQMLNYVIVLCVICSAIGSYFALAVGWPIFVLVFAGGVLAIEYTAPPLRLKYRALGDLAVLLCFGLGMLFGTYTVLAHRQPGAFTVPHLLVVLVYALPSASLVVAILQANNHRDRQADREAGAKTLANTLSFEQSKRLLFNLLIGPYVVVAIGACIGSLTLGPVCLLALAVFVTLPALRKLLEPMQSDRYERAVPAVAKLHGQFGFVLALAVVAQILIAHRPA